MKPQLQTIQVCFNFLKTDFVATIEFYIQNHASTGTAPSLTYPGDPGEPAEFVIEKIELRDDGKDNPPVLELPEWLDILIGESDLVNDAIQEFDWESRHDYDGEY
jgi:hypothetical protein